MARHVRLIVAVALMVLVGVPWLGDAAAAERLPAKSLMEKLRDDGEVELERGTVVTGDVILMDGVSLTAIDVTFDGIVTSLPLPPGSPPPR
jgi:hypothetical protein